MMKSSSVPDPGGALNVEKIRAELQRAFHKKNEYYDIRKGKIDYVEFRGGGPSVILYRFVIEDRLTRQVHDRQFAGLPWEGERLPDLPAEDVAKFRELDDVLQESVLWSLPACKVLLYAFPYDPSLPWLLELMNPRKMKEKLNTLWENRKWNVAEIRISPVSYKPFARAVFLYRAQIEDKTTGRTEWREFVAKSHVRRAPDRLFASSWALWKACSDRIGLSRPEGYLLDPRLTLQEKISAQRMGSLFGNRPLNDLMRQTASSLAELHRARIPLHKVRKSRHEIRGLSLRSSFLSDVLPDLKSRMETFRRSLISEMEARFKITGPVHGDFHHTNILTDGVRVWFIDFDGMGYGDLRTDVGRLLASLRVHSLWSAGSISGVDEGRDAFLEEYLRLTAEEISDVYVFEAASLLASAVSGFRIQRPQWSQDVSVILDEAERLLRLSGQDRVTYASPSRQKRPELTSEERFVWAGDPVFMQAILEPFVEENFGCEIRECTVTGDFSSRMHYVVRCDTKKGSRIINLEGVDSPDWKSSRFRLIEAVQNGSNHRLDAGVIPSAVGYAEPVSMLIWEKLEGIAWVSLLGRKEVPAACEKLGKALAILHQTKLPESSRSRSMRSLTRAVESRIENLVRHGVQIPEKAESFLNRIFSLIGDLDFRPAITLGDFSPSDVLWLDGRIGFSHPGNFNVSCPLLDLGRFSAQLKIAGFQTGRSYEAEKAIDILLSAYEESTAEKVENLSASESFAMIELAASRWETEQQDMHTLQLINLARKLSEKTIRE